VKWWACSALQKVVANLVNHPDDPKYRRVSLHNATFNSALGSKPQGIKCMLIIGFELHKYESENSVRRF
jgi:PUB domain